MKDLKYLCKNNKELEYLYSIHNYNKDEQFYFNSETESLKLKNNNIEITKKKFSKDVIIFVDFDNNPNSDLCNITFCKEGTLNTKCLKCEHMCDLTYFKSISNIIRKNKLKEI
jgi:hypothetical protein